MRTIRQLVSVSITSSVVATLLATEFAVRSVEDFGAGWRHGIR